jgi:hypothetical protein
MIEPAILADVRNCSSLDRREDGSNGNRDGRSESFKAVSLPVFEGQSMTVMDLGT